MVEFFLLLYVAVVFIHQLVLEETTSTYAYQTVSGLIF